MQNNKKTTIRKVFCLCLVVILFLAFFFIGSHYSPERNRAEAEEGTTAAENTTEKLSVIDLLKAAKSLKNDLTLALDDIKKNDLESAKLRIGEMSPKIHSIRSSVEHTIALFNGSVPFLQDQLVSIQELLDAADMAIEKLVLPGIELMQAHPLSEVRVGDGLNVMALSPYLDFIESVMPDIEVLVACANSVDLSLFDTEGEISGYLETANELLDIYRNNTSIISEIKSLLGIEGDRLYLLVAQNSSEIRAAGGFPGSIGTARIQNGILTLGDFRSVYDVLPSSTPRGTNITSTEYKLFNYLSGMQVPRDAELCPDFERIGQIWAAAYEAKNGEPVAGVISMTPSIVQRLLAVVDEEVELFDGLVLHADNATKVLQYDIYFKYFSKNYVSGRDSISDQLFADAAQKTMEKLMNNMTASHLLAYMSVAKESFADRTLMLWMDDTAEQALISQMGWSGGLNTDPQKPQAGVYFNLIHASKMGWFMSINTDIGERIPNEDGSYTYPVTVTFSNNITQEEIKTASDWILGGLGGAIRGAAYFFAPAEGSISDFTVSNGSKIAMENYHDLQLGYIRAFNIYPGESVTVTYNITTAPGVEAPLEFSKTPTVQEYR